MSKVIQIEQAKFDHEIMHSEIPVVVDFFATWCPPCRALGPILDRLADEFEGRIKFVKIDSDQEVDLARQFNVTSLPTVVLFDDGNLVGSFSGLPEEEALRSELKKWIGANSET